LGRVSSGQSFHASVATNAKANASKIDNPSLIWPQITTDKT